MRVTLRGEFERAERMLRRAKAAEDRLALADEVIRKAQAAAWREGYSRGRDWIEGDDPPRNPYGRP